MRRLADLVQEAQAQEAKRREANLAESRLFLSDLAKFSDMGLLYA